MYTTYALEAAYAYEYSFARKLTYSSTSFLIRRCGDDSPADARLFVRRCNDRQWMLDDYVTVLISRPRGSVHRIRSSGIFSITILRSDWGILVVRS